ncbi:MAG: hypothetical protein PVG11_02670 [Anaerolineae bacterium]
MEGSKSGPGTQAGPVHGRLHTVRGEPYHIGGHTLTPVARVASYSRGQGTLQGDQVEGWGMGFVHVTPLAVLVEDDGDRHRIRVTSSADNALRAMGVAALLLTLLCWGLRLVVRRQRRTDEAA